jgi:hypothetical protein
MNVVQHGLGDEARNSSESLLISIRHSEQNALGKEARIPLESLSIYTIRIRWWGMLFHEDPHRYLLGVHYSMLWMRRPMFHYNPY